MEWLLLGCRCDCQRQSDNVMPSCGRLGLGSLGDLLICASDLGFWPMVSWAWDLWVDVFRDEGLLNV